MFSSLKPFESCSAVYARTSVSACKRGSRKPIKLQLHPHDTLLRRNCHREILATRAILFQSRGLQIAFVKISPALQAGREFATRQRDEYETDCFTILQQTVPASRSLFTRALNLPSSCTRYGYAIFAYRSLHHFTNRSAWKTLGLLFCVSSVAFQNQ